MLDAKDDFGEVFVRWDPWNAYQRARRIVDAQASAEGKTWILVRKEDADHITWIKREWVRLQDRIEGRSQ